MNPSLLGRHFNDPMSSWKVGGMKKGLEIKKGN